MRIKDISVENYRNLNSATITFDESCNFIVGENNLGKSNILNLLNIIFTRRGFVYDDFNDANLPITVNIRIKLTNDEIGHFEDLFDIDDYTLPGTRSPRPPRCQRAYPLKRCPRCWDTQT